MDVAIGVILLTQASCAGTRQRSAAEILGLVPPVRLEIIDSLLDRKNSKVIEFRGGDGQLLRLKIQLGGEAGPTGPGAWQVFALGNRRSGGEEISRDSDISCQAARIARELIQGSSTQEERERIWGQSRPPYDSTPLEISIYQSQWILPYFERYGRCGGG